MRRLLRVAFSAGSAALLAVLGACGSHSAKPDRPTAALGSSSPDAAATRATVVGEEPWTFESVPGRAVRTSSYRVFTIVPRGRSADDLPMFLEQALLHYRTAITVLPPPPVAMDAYVLANRSQWQRLTRTVLGDGAGPYINIPRGGVAVGGKAMYFDIGTRDTFVIAAHEGWHQYTQTAFRDPLPVWLDEGVATFMEGFSWDHATPGLAAFNGWNNLERYDALRRGVQSDTLLSLEALVNLGPADLVEAGPDVALVVYAQMWALIHFLREGENGEFASSLRQMLADAASGEMSVRLARDAGPRAGEQFRSRRAGADVFRIYTGRSAASIERAYRATIEQIIALGGRDAVVAGRSPLTMP
ncbi:MAG: DUF1570 domain-containing protein [Planctomycetota bacterium]|nr:DUF1570 domain-containing protein [Planctomycetota bacterium]